MTRHAKNCTAGAVYSYHEKKKDAKASGYGSNAQRIGKDSVKNFDCCCLTLQPCQNPVITNDGYLYDKEAILEYVIAKRNEAIRKLKEYERQNKREQQELAEIAEAERQSQVEKFVAHSKAVVSTSQPGVSGVSSVSNMANGKNKNLPSFWVPSMTPAAKQTVMTKPDKTVYCPMSGKPLKIKDLIPVKFTEVKDPDDKKSLIAKENRYMCPITHDILSNSVPSAVLKPSGDVVTMECVEKIIKKDWTNPLTGEKLTEKDIIVLQRGGTGFSSVNKSLEGKEHRPVLQV